MTQVFKVSTVFPAVSSESHQVLELSEVSKGLKGSAASCVSRREQRHRDTHNPRDRCRFGTLEARPRAL